MFGSMNRVIVLAVVEGGLPVSEAAERFGVPPQWVYVQLAGDRNGRLDGLEPRSQRLADAPRDAWDGS